MGLRAGQRSATQAKSLSQTSQGFRTPGGLDLRTQNPVQPGLDEFLEGGLPLRGRHFGAVQ